MLPRLLLVIAVATGLGACISTPEKTVKVDGIDISESKADSAAAIYAELGLRYMQKGNFKLAMQKLRKAIALDPELPSTYLYLGQLYATLDELPDAESNYRKAITMDPDYSRGHNNYGAFLCTHERYQESEQQFLAAISNPLYENAAATLENLGLCSLAAGETAKAEGYFKQALKKSPYLGRSLFNLAQISYDHKDYQAASSALNAIDW